MSSRVQPFQGRVRRKRDRPTVVNVDHAAASVIEGLYVIDASIMPDIVSAPTNVTTIMMAEAIARRLDGGDGDTPLLRT